MTTWDDLPEGMSPDEAKVARACLRIIAGRADHGLPEQVARYIKGETDSLPVSLGWVPESRREALRVARSIVEDATRRRREKEAARKQWAAMFPAPMLHQPLTNFERAIEGDATGTAGDLRIEFCPTYETAHYTGTRAQLEAEGLIPQPARWPQGRCSVQWERGSLHFSLRRTKPEGVTGRVKEWEAADWWTVRVSRVGSHRQTLVRAKMRELERALHEASHAGEQAFYEQWRRSCAARDDARFQAMLSAMLPPGIKREPARRGSPAKVATATKGAAA
jgi:hypothetical protein